MKMISVQRAEESGSAHSAGDPVRFRMNRLQQLVVAGASLLLLFFALVPPWKSTGTDQFLGFYPILGKHAQTALQAGGEAVTVHISLMALLIGAIFVSAGMFYGALAVTREDWAALLTRMAQDSGVRHAAEVPGLLGLVRDRVAGRVDNLMARVDFNLARVRSGDSQHVVRPTSVEQHVLRKITDEMARGSMAKAEELLLRVRGHAYEKQGENSTFVDELDFRYANLLRDRGDLARAEELYHRCIVRREALYGENDLRVATALQSYAKLMLVMRRRVLAKRLDQLAATIREHNRRPVIDALPVFGDGPIPPEYVLALPPSIEKSHVFKEEDVSPVSRKEPR